MKLKEAFYKQFPISIIEVHFIIHFFWATTNVPNNDCIAKLEGNQAIRLVIFMFHELRARINDTIYTYK